MLCLNETWTSSNRTELVKLNWSENSPPLTDPKDLLPCLQVPATGPCPEPDDSRPHPVTLRSILILSHLWLVFPSGLFPSGFTTKGCVGTRLYYACYIRVPYNIDFLILIILKRTYEENLIICGGVLKNGKRYCGQIIGYKEIKCRVLCRHL